MTKIYRILKNTTHGHRVELHTCTQSPKIATEAMNEVADSLGPGLFAIRITDGEITDVQEGTR